MKNMKLYIYIIFFRFWKFYLSLFGCSSSLDASFPQISISLLTFIRIYLAVLGLYLLFPSTSNIIWVFSVELIESSNTMLRKIICRAYNIKFCSTKDIDILVSPFALPSISRTCLPSAPPAMRIDLSENEHDDLEWQLNGRHNNIEIILDLII